MGFRGREGTGTADRKGGENRNAGGRSSSQGELSEREEEVIEKKSPNRNRKGNDMQDLDSQVSPNRFS